MADDGLSEGLASTKISLSFRDDTTCNIEAAIRQWQVMGFRGPVSYIQLALHCRRFQSQPSEHPVIPIRVFLLEVSQDFGPLVNEFP